MAKNIDKNKIVKYVAAGLLTTSLLGCAGLKIYDSTIDHTEEVCPICRMENNVIYVDGELGTVGINHQKEQIEKEYKKAGKDYDVVYVSDYRDKEITEEITYAITLNSSNRYYSLPRGYQFIEKDGKYYGIPEGYVLEERDGKMYGVRDRTNYLSEPYQAIVTYGVDEETGLEEEISAMRVGK